MIVFRFSAEERCLHRCVTANVPCSSNHEHYAEAHFVPVDEPFRKRKKTSAFRKCQLVKYAPGPPATRTDPGTSNDWLGIPDTPWKFRPELAQLRARQR